MKLETGKVYHVMNKSIAQYKIFNNDDEFSRFLETFVYYQNQNSIKFSDLMEHEASGEELLDLVSSKKERRVQIISFCIMPTHFHFLLRQVRDDGISKFLNDTLNSYTRFFNEKHKRKGPLWVAKTKKKPVETDESLLHLTRYLHLNPTTSYLVDKPENWEFSSYREFLGEGDKEFAVCEFDDLLDIKPASYRKFVADRIGYQRELKKIKDLLLE